MAAIALILMVVSCLFSQAGFAGETWTFSFGKDQFDRLNSESPVFNLKCLELLKNKKNCRANEALKRASMRQIRENGGNGQINPGLLVCARLQGSVRIGKDSDGNENAFCEFSDESRVSCGSLLRAAIDQDGEKTF